MEVVVPYSILVEVTAVAPPYLTEIVVPDVLVVIVRAVSAQAVVSTDVDILVSFTDATPENTSFYQLEWNVNGGPATLISDLGIVPAASLSYVVYVPALGGDSIYVRTRAAYGTSEFDLVYGDWSAWSDAYTISGVSVPLTSIVVTRYVPQVGVSARVYAVAKTVSVVPQAPAVRVSRYARPVEDLSDGAWLASEGSDLYAMLDESEYSDTDYIYTNTAGTSCTLRLSQLSNPAPIDTKHVLRYRGQGIFTVTLYCGATEVASWNEDLSSIITIERDLTSGQKALITDYDNLRVVLET